MDVLQNGIFGNFGCPEFKLTHQLNLSLRPLGFAPVFGRAVVPFGEVLLPRLKA
jgi:hypothetical protein